MSRTRQIEEKLPDSGQLAEPRRVRESIRNTLSLDERAAKELIRRLPEGEFKGYQDVCTVMSKKHKQWSRILLLELPFENLSGENLSPNSSLKAAYPLDNSPDEIFNQATLRAEYLNLLYNEVPSSEKECYSHLLALKNMPKGLPADAMAALTIYEIDQLFHDAFHEQERRFQDENGLEVTPPIQGVRPLAEFVGSRVFDFVASVLAEVPSGAPDSLAARLILNAALNRAILEVDEHQRLSNEATVTLCRLLAFLKAALPEGIPPVESASDVSQVLLNVFGGPAPASEGARWRSLDEPVLGKILMRSTGLLKYFCANRSNGHEADFRIVHLTPANLLMMSLTVSWVYCTAEKLDVGVSGLKNRSVEIMGGRAKEEDIVLPAAVTAFHCRLYGHLFYSGQLNQLNPMSLNAYQAGFSHKRNQKRRIYIELLKQASLAQWSALAGRLQVSCT